MEYDIGIVRRRRILPANESYFVVPAPVAPSYTGPVDVYGAAIGYWGLRAMSAAYAATLGPCIDVFETNGGTGPYTINVLANGNIDAVAIAALYVSFPLALTVSKIYDQTGAGIHATAAGGLRAVLVQNAVGAGSTLPTMTFTGGSQYTITLPAQAQPYTTTLVAKVTNGFGAQQTFFAASTDGVQLGFNAGGDNTWYAYAGSVNTKAATDSAYHAQQALLNGASSNNYIDGSANVAAGGAVAIAAASGFIGDVSSSGVQPLQGNILEFGLWAGDKSASFSTLNTNQHTYWNV